MKHRTRLRVPRHRDSPEAKPHGWPPAALAVAAFVLAGITALAFWLIPVPRSGGSAASSTRPVASTDSGWTVGMLRPDGLRIVVSGREDASAVLDPQRFSHPAVKRGYRIAAEIPAVLNKLYCWCGCENRGEHRSALQCFEDEMAADCAVCLGTAQIAYDMTRKGITDAAKIQAAVDVMWRDRR
jgi:hypothetical protein